MGVFNPYAQYQKVMYNTADQGSLILMTYDAAIRFCQSGKDCINSDDIVSKGRWLSKAFDCVAELRKSLRPDAGGDIAKHLNDAYAFVSRQITLANVNSNTEPLDNALLVLGNLRGAWKEIIQKERKANPGSIG